MGKDVIFDYSKAAAFIHEEEIAGIKAGVQAARETLVEKTGAGNDFLGWIDLPVDYDKEEFGRIKKAAEKIQKDSDVLLVIGIGGSYLGARAAIEFLSHSFYNNLPKEKRRRLRQKGALHFKPSRHVRREGRRRYPSDLRVSAQQRTPDLPGQHRSALRAFERCAEEHGAACPPCDRGRHVEPGTFGY